MNCPDISHTGSLIIHHLNTMSLQYNTMPIQLDPFFIIFVETLIIFNVTTLAANIMESLLLNGICVNLIGIYCFWSYVQFRNEILLISSIHYVTKLNGQTQSVLSGTAETPEKDKSEFRGSHLK